uniref:Uncharacterized protein n=1 Tax=Siphoviridae sp. ct37J14 TaxID=2826280 RepID=A0A8S5M0U1_9CAUD|nr:MAG TPA: hypothetical protein [Siphoviridae sp. ct37J14]
MAIDIEVLEKGYFYFDKPVPYKLSDKTHVDITPISVYDSEVFLSSCDILQIDKNALNSVEIIQMSYLDFLLKVMLPTDKSGLLLDKLSNIFRLCLGMKTWKLKVKEKQKLSIVATDDSFEITGKQFDDIKRIILYQNVPHYDDTYIDPDLKKMMGEVDRLKSQGISTPNLERRMAIITAHCGIDKKTLMQYTMRSLQLLFEECAGEVEFTTLRPMMLYAGKAKELEHWIYKKKKDRLDGYVTSVESYNKSMGGDGVVKQANSDMIKQINNIVNQ